MSILVHLNRLARGGLYSLSKRWKVQGVEIRYFMPLGSKGAEGQRKVSEAIDLIARYDPVRLPRIRRDLRGIWVFAAAGNLAEYHHHSRLCLLDFQFVEDDQTTVLRIASTIVHEATHARLCGVGFSYDEPFRRRLERICHNAEVAFALHLPQDMAATIVEDAHSSIAQDPVVWTNGAAEERRLRRLRELGAPEWFIRLSGRKSPAV